MTELAREVAAEEAVARHGDRVAIVGAFHGTHIGASLARAAARRRMTVTLYDTDGAMRANGLVRAALWRFGGHRPARLDAFSAEVVAGCAEARPKLLIATGAAPLTRSALRRLRGMGIACFNYSTDDPWNKALRSSWHLRALPEYDAVFTTRSANIGCFRKIGCADVRYLPFGYDDELFPEPPEPRSPPRHDVLFVGGADDDRIAFMTKFLKSGLSVALVGGYWQRCPATRSHALGRQPPATVARLTASSRINLCLVRRANRDGHVMRSFEIAALGGCMLAEDTAEHRRIFGLDGEAVAYFRTPDDAAVRARALLADNAERARLAAAVRQRIVAGGHTYRDRLDAMLAAAVGRTGRATMP
ncbi:MAG: glycosyltransferase [Alphaproteobacteria bacterium]